ncbi:hypothetical protein F4859DRAFT_467717 [Xylaria cf. heliscus]|nr:hypothetical protein F4859DRAFT_467717 [Xylaria cf. heliscus]
MLSSIFVCSHGSVVFPFSLLIAFVGGLSYTLFYIVDSALLSLLLYWFPYAHLVHFLISLQHLSRNRAGSWGGFDSERVTRGRQEDGKTGGSQGRREEGSIARTRLLDT